MTSNLTTCALVSSFRILIIQLSLSWIKCIHAQLASEARSPLSLCVGSGENGDLRVYRRINPLPSRQLVRSIGRLPLVSPSRYLATISRCPWAVGITYYFQNAWKILLSP